MEQHQSGRGVNDDREGRYANYFEVAHSAFEFMIDFGQYQSHSDSKQRVTAFLTIVTSPAHAKTLAGMLFESVRQYELTYGAIEDTHGLRDRHTSSESLDGDR